MVMLEYWITKTFLQKAVTNWSEKVFVIKKVKNTVPWKYAVRDLKGKESVGKATIVLLTVGLIKKT